MTPLLGAADDLEPLSQYAGGMHYRRGIVSVLAILAVLRALPPRSKWLALLFER